MKRLLFVDDDQDILRGLKRMLRPYKNEWEAVMVDSGEEALQILEQSQFDCIVSDMRMPKMNGAELLTKVYERHPEVARFVLSGHADSQPIIQAIPVTHQYLSKPCSPEQLINSVRRALDLHSLIGDEEIKTTIGKVDSLPSRPEVFSQLNRELTLESSSLATVAQIIEKDVAISAKVLKVVNSAFFGLPQNMSKVSDAVAYLGVNMVKSLVLSEEMARSFALSKKVPEYSLDSDYKLSLAAAKIAKQLVKGREHGENAFMSGVLHRTGRLLMAEYMPDKLRATLTVQKESKGVVGHKVDRDVVGVPSEYIGAYLLGLWGLPYPVVEAVAHHNTPWVVEHEEFGVLDALYVTLQLLTDYFPELRNDELNMDYLQKLGVANELDKWRELIESEMTGAEVEV